MKYAVTGGAGFIGSHLIKSLLEEGHTVTAIDNLNTGKMDNLESILDNIDFVKGDLRDFELLKNKFRDVDGVFHEAALASVQESFSKEKEYNEVNVGGTENVLKLAKEFGFKIVYASSSSVYGNPHTTPISEEFERNPINPYGITKLEDELLAKKYSEIGTKIIGLRYFNVYGSGQNLDYAGVITKFYDNIMNNKSPVIFGDGMQVRDFVSVEDVVKANLLSMQSQFDFGFINIGTGIGTSIKELAKIMISLSGKQLELIHGNLPEGDVKSSQADTAFARQTISWQYVTPLVDGLRKFFFNS